MQLLELGDQFINMDLVTDIQVTTATLSGNVTAVTVHFAVAGSDQTRSARFQGPEAEALREWLRAHAERLFLQG